MNLNQLVPWHWGQSGEAADGESSPLHTLQQQMNEAFEKFTKGVAGKNQGWPPMFSRLSPKINVKETDQVLHVEAELPGLEEKDIELTLQENLLVIKAERCERKEEQDEKNEQVYRREIAYGSLYRAVPLPARVDHSKVEAHFKNGVLTVDLPKTPVQPENTHRINIMAG